MPEKEDIPHREREREREIEREREREREMCVEKKIERREQCIAAFKINN